MKGKGCRLAILLALVLTLVSAFGLTAFAEDGPDAEDTTTETGYNYAYGIKPGDSITSNVTKGVNSFKVEYVASQLQYVPQDAPGGPRPEVAAWVGVKMTAPSTVTSDGLNNTKVKYTYLYTDKADVVKNYTGSQFYEGQVSDGRYYGVLWVHISEDDVKDALGKTREKGIIKAEAECDWDGVDTTDNTTYDISINVNDLVLYNTSGKKILKTVDGELVSTITFVAQNGSDGVVTQDVPLGVTTKLRANSFTYADHLFKYWAAAPNSDVKAYDDEDNINTEEDKTLYAVWEAHSKHDWEIERNDDTHDVTFSCKNEKCKFHDGVTAGVRAADKTYDGQASTITPVVSDADLVKVDCEAVTYYEGFSLNKKLSYVPKDAGEFTAQAKFYYKKDNGTWGPFGSVWDFYTIDPAQLEVTEPVAEDDLEYNAEAQDLIESDAVVVPAGKGDVLYAVTEADVTEAPAADSDLWDVKAVAMNAGPYKVWYKAVPNAAAEGNYSESEVDYIVATIAAKPVHVHWANMDGVAITTPTYTDVYEYDGDDYWITGYLYTGDDKVNDVKAIYSDGIGYTARAKDHRVEGNYTAEVIGIQNSDGSENTNYVVEATPDYPVSKEWNIKQIPLTITVNDGAITYGDSVDDAIDAVNELSYDGFAEGDSKDNVEFDPAIADFEYSFKNEAGDEYAAGSDIGEYAATITSDITAQNYIVTVDPGTLTVGQKTLSFIWKDEDGNEITDLSKAVEYTYDGNRHRVSVAIDPDSILPDDEGKVAIKTIEDKTYATNHRVKNDEADFTPTVKKLKGAKSENYTFIPAGKEGSTATLSWRINRADLTISAFEPDAITYGDNPPRTIKLNYDGLKNGEGEGANHDQDPSDPTQPNPDAETAVMSSEPEVHILDENDNPYEPGSDVSSDTHKYVIKIRTTGISSTNYNIKVSEEPVYLTVVPKKIDLSWYHVDKNAVKTPIPRGTGHPYKVTYDGDPHHIVAEPASDGVLPQDRQEGCLSVVLEGDILDTNAGDYQANFYKLAGTRSDNYDVDTSNYQNRWLKWKISKAELTITPKDVTVQYGGTPKDNYVTYEGLADIDKDDEGRPESWVLDGTLKYEFKHKDRVQLYKPGDPVGDDYITVVSGVTAKNYNITFMYGKLAVVPRAVKVIWSTPKSFVYNGATQGVNIVSADNDYADDSVMQYLTSTGNTGRDAKGYTATAVLSGEGAKKYVVTGNASYPWEITKKAVTVTANNKTIYLNDAPANAGYTATGLVGGDSVGTVTYTYTYKQYGKPGNYSINPAVTNVNPNYTVKTNPGTLTVKDNVNTLVAKAIASGNTKAYVSWNAITNAASYDVYLAKCNHGGKVYSCRKVATVKGTSYTAKGLKKGTWYKYYVIARRSNGSQISKTLLNHFVAGNDDGKTTNAKSLSVKSNKVNLSVGKTSKISASQKAAKARRSLRNSAHKSVALYRYRTSNSRVATVSGNGTIKAVGSGYCRVYVQAINGLWNTIEVNVN